MSPTIPAPRVTKEDVLATIASEHYFTALQGAAFAAVGRHLEEIPAALGEVTFCVLILKNGHKIVGVNTGSISPKLFDAELARKLAREDALDRIWPLLGYQLREKLFQDSLVPPEEC